MFLICLCFSQSLDRTIGFGSIAPMSLPLGLCVERFWWRSAIWSGSDWVSEAGTRVTRRTRFLLGRVFRKGGTSWQGEGGSGSGLCWVQRVRSAQSTGPQMEQLCLLSVVLSGGGQWGPGQEQAGSGEYSSPNLLSLSTAGLAGISFCLAPHLCLVLGKSLIWESRRWRHSPAPRSL